MNKAMRSKSLINSSPKISSKKNARGKQVSIDENNEASHSDDSPTPNEHSFVKKELMKQ